MIDIKAYIDSGVLETYVLGVASEDDARQLLQLKKDYPEINYALTELEKDLERIAAHMAVPPPPGMFERIVDTIDDLVIAPGPGQLGRPLHRNNDSETSNGRESNRFIEVEAESNYMRIHKAWKWVFAAVFVLGKVFLACAIYYYLESRQALQQVNELKTELKQLKSR